MDAQVPREIPNRGPQLMAVDISFAVMALIACLLRVFTRLYMVKAFGLDDVLMVISTVSTAVSGSRWTLLGSPLGSLNQTFDTNM